MWKLELPSKGIVSMKSKNRKNPDQINNKIAKEIPPCLKK
jgi:hypothetical protein